jgi:hypothetical protein
MSEKKTENAISPLGEDTSPFFDDLEAVDQENKTPLMRAVEKEDIEAAILLIGAGAKINASLYMGDKRKMDFLRLACEGAVSPFPASGRLEENAASWGVYWKERLPSFSKTNLVLGTGDSTEEKVLKLSLHESEPNTFAHFYLNLEPRGKAVHFGLSMRLQIAQETTYNNAGGNSLVPALELSISKFNNKRRYEFAWQWQNVGEGAPQWRLWDAARGWASMGIKHKLTSRTWHFISFTGKVLRDKVYYDILTIDGVKFVVNKEVAATPLKDPYDYLSVAVQLDGNTMGDPYVVYIKDVALEVKE